MGDVMAWRENTDDQLAFSDACSVIQRAVLLQRRTGLKNEHAIETVADLFQLSPRRVRAWLYGEVFNPQAVECLQIVRRWYAARDLEVARLRVLAEEVERQNERERVALAQLELPLGSSNAESHKGPDRRAANAIRAVARRLDAASRAEAAYRAQRRGPLK